MKQNWHWLVCALSIWLALCVQMFGCVPVPPPVDPSAPPATCDEACRNVLELGCPFPEACPRACGRILRPSFRSCVKAAASCAAVDACGQ